MDEKKVREAIELIRMEINTLEGIENCGRVIEARKKKHIALYNIAIEALEKQLPKQPELINNGISVCKECGAKVFRHYAFCRDCGQRLDWSK